VKRKKTGFTMVEILTVVGIIAILVAVLIPTLTMVRRIAKETQQKAQLTTIDLAMMAFKGDYGDYPPSDNYDYDYCGAQKLAEALLGWDLLGFHPDSEWNAGGKDDSDNEIYPDPLDITNLEHIANLEARRGPYVELATANGFTLRQLFGDGIPTMLVLDRFVICDVFGIKRVTLANSETVKAGTPILYYRANTSSKKIIGGRSNTRIYNMDDNYDLIDLKSFADETDDRLLEYDGEFFYSYAYKIIDPKVTAIPWPYRPDSYILISAGADGLYGTSDDICNF